MAKAAISPIDIYELLPRINCGECGEKTCIAFATRLASREAKLQDCTPLLTPELKETYQKLREMLKRPVKEITIGEGDKAVRIGGKLVMYRHELAYHNPTAIAMEVSDQMSEEEMLKRLRATEAFSHTDYFGDKLELNMIAVRSISNDPKRFQATVRKVEEMTRLPLILCSFNPEIIKCGLRAKSGMRPLLYAATKDNWRDMAEIALDNDCPLAVFAPNDLRLLRSLTKTLLEYGIPDIVLDPGTFPSEGLKDTINNFTIIRRSACKLYDELFGFPLLGTPVTAWLAESESSIDATWNEALLATMLITRFADILIMHSLERWSLLPILTLRSSLYRDPRWSHRTGLIPLGKPTGNSPVILVTRMHDACVYDLAKHRINCHIVILNYHWPIGLLLMYGALDDFADRASTLIEKSGIEKIVEHRELIVPGAAALVKARLEEKTEWKIIWTAKATDLVGFLKTRKPRSVD